MLRTCDYPDLQEDVILKLDNSAQIFNTLSDIPGDVTDAEQLLLVGTMSAFMRRKHFVNLRDWLLVEVISESSLW